MRPNLPRAVCLSFVWLAVGCPPLLAELKLPAIFGDHMVFQREAKAPVWGWADPGEKVTITFAGQKKSTTADKDGKWTVRLDPMPANAEGQTLTVSSGIRNLQSAPRQAQGGEHRRTTIRNVVVGDVWLCSGQSNMASGARGSVPNWEEEALRTDYPSIRSLSVKHKLSLFPEQDVEGAWVVCTPRTAGSFSGAAFFFGRSLHEKLKIPIGLIHSSRGATRAEVWVSRETLGNVPALKPELDRLDRARQSFDEVEKEYLAVRERADQARKEAIAELTKREADEELAREMAAPSLDANSWKEVTVPTRIFDHPVLGQCAGEIWFRKTVEIPREWAGKDVQLYLGAIDEIDVTFLNGTKIGASGSVAKRDISNWDQPRAYKVPGDLVKAGPNVVAVRVFNFNGAGGIWGARPEQLRIELAGAQPAGSVPIAGTWRYRAAFRFPPRAPDAPLCSRTPSAYFNGMIHPLIPFGLRGAIWYQGESNVGNGYRYRSVFRSLIQDWRTRWGQGDFPFLFVQLPNFSPPVAEPSPSLWAEVREAQLMTLSLPNTGMAVTIEVGDPLDLHPKNKRDVGDRLALAARGVVYKEEGLVFSGPIYESMRVEGNRIRLSFRHVGSGLVARDGKPLSQFAIAGSDRKFVWAQAKIEGNSVVVWNEKVPHPVGIRYAWANNPEGCNLANKEGLPASPFRTDDWPIVSEPQRQ